MAVMTENEMGESERRALVDDAAQTIAKLGILIAQLEPDAKGDKRIQQELATLISERRAAEGALSELLAGGRREQDARELEATQAAQAREAHLERARELGAERVKAAKAVDEGLRQFALALETYHHLSQQQANELMSSGNRSAAGAARPRPHRVTAAVAFALRECRVPTGAVETVTVSPSHVLPLLSSDPVAI